MNKVSWFTVVLFLCQATANGQVEQTATETALPNVLWLSVEDIGPHLGCYGDRVAKTPNLDRLASQGALYDLAWSNYPVCAPARTTLISGLYASSMAAGHMRCSIPLDNDLRLFPEYLREANYYCSNNSKEDYNVQQREKVWDQSNSKAHYRHRNSGQPFFAVFNHTGTHESKIRKRPHELKTDPTQIIVPPYHPDAPEVRHDWAQYYDNIANMDRWVGQKLQQLADDGLEENTIVVFFGDHGSGMPRHKRYAGDSGMRVPLIVYVPESLKHFAPKGYKPGARLKRPVGFVDFAPTMLSLANIKPPESMQGNAFMGPFETSAPNFVYGFRSRMDEHIDCSRSICDGRYVYIRNLMPHLPHGQPIDYQLQTKTTALWRKRFEEGKLNEVQSKFWRRKATEELYDLENDPFETRNLATSDDEAIQKLLTTFREAHRESAIEFGDIELLPEPVTARMSADRSAYDLSRSEPLMQALFDAASAASDSASNKIDELFTVLESERDDLETVGRRHWASVGLLIRVDEAIRDHRAKLRSLLNDRQMTVRVNAAEVLARSQNETDVRQAIATLVDAANMENSDYFSAIWALNALDRLNQRGINIAKGLDKLPRSNPELKRGNDYVKRLIEGIIGDGKGRPSPTRSTNK